MSAELGTLSEVFRHGFEDDELTVTRETKAADIESLDSLMHVSLILAVERKFGIRFPSSEVSSLMNVGMLMFNAKTGASRG